MAGHRVGRERGINSRDSGQELNGHGVSAVGKPDRQGVAAPLKRALSVLSASDEATVSVYSHLQFNELQFKMAMNIQTM